MEEEEKEADDDESNEVSDGVEEEEEGFMARERGSPCERSTSIRQWRPETWARRISRMALPCSISIDIGVFCLYKKGEERVQQKIPKKYKKEGKSKNG